VIKTTVECAPAVRDAIEELHSYELPECIVLSVEDGSAAYLEWLQSAVRTESDL
jgi:periplasmic divalent cation tolerance protein